MAAPTEATNYYALPDDGEVDLYWNKSVGPDLQNQKIYRKLTSEGAGSYVLKQTLGNTEETWTDATVSNGTSYDYKLTSLNSGAEESTGIEVTEIPCAPGTITLLEPTNAEQINDDTPPLSFIIPTDAGDHRMVFIAEVDTNNPPDSGSADYIKLQSRLAFNPTYHDGDWQVYRSDSQLFEVLPTGGCLSSDYGATCKVSVPHIFRLRDLINEPKTWYWRIGASNRIPDICPKFGETTSVFGQVKFCSG